jgi:hypothetical protein
MLCKSCRAFVLRATVIASSLSWGGFDRLYAVVRRVDRIHEGAIRAAIDRGTVSAEESSTALAHLVATTLDRAGILDYRSNVDASGFVARAGLEPYLERSARLAARTLLNAEPTPVDHQRPTALQHPGDLGTAFGQTRTPAEWHVVQGGEDQGREALDRGADKPEGGETKHPSGYRERTRNADELRHISLTVLTSARVRARDKDERHGQSGDQDRPKTLLTAMIGLIVLVATGLNAR